MDRARFYRHVARVSQRASRRRAAIRYYLQAAVRDRQYRRHGLPADLAEIAQGVGRQMRRRLAGPPAAPGPRHGAARLGQRDAVLAAWVEEARRWLEELAAQCSGSTGHGA